ncbi:MAG: hypothetical protein MUE50_07305 [Pirellulaceae bacterium]|jgi:hypothetical protein|nr:hypothetical protein [Pirellulaceae bacterium]
MPVTITRHDSLARQLEKQKIQLLAADARRNIWTCCTVSQARTESANFLQPAKAHPNWPESLARFIARQNGQWIDASF